MNFLVGIIWEVAKGGSQSSLSETCLLPCAPSSLLSSMVCLCFLGGSWMTALALILIVLSPPLAWARDTPRKCTPWVVSYFGGVGRKKLVLPLCPGHVP